MIPHNQPFFNNRESKAVQKVLASKWIIAGGEVEKFENRFKSLIGREYAIAVTSGHAAIHLSLLELKIGKDSEVILPTYTPQDVANPIYYAGAKPVIVDIEKDSFNIDPQQIRRKLTSKTKAIIVPHMFGFGAKIDQIKKFGIPIVEDCAQSLGSYYRGKPLGFFGEIAVFSFYASKVITSGQGGMILTNNKKKYLDIKDLINYNGRDNYRVRYNYSLTDIAAGIGNAQVAKLKKLLRIRKSIGKRYRGVLKNKNVEYFPKDEEAGNINHFRFIIKFSTKNERDNFMNGMAKEGIITIVPLYNFELLHNLFGQNKKEYPNAEKMSHTSVSIPIFPGLTNQEIEKITSALDALL